MINFLHTFEPQRLLLTIGPINIYWYGIFVTLGILAGLGVVIKLAKYYQIDKELIYDLAFWLIIFGILGARIYDDLLELPYYIQHPLDSIKIWQGGLAIHGGIIAGLLIVWWFSKKHQLNFWLVNALLAPGLALGQAIGRWGNYFNQELFGQPTDLPWGIPIDVVNRPADYLTSQYFHPTFLYESIGNLFIFLILISLHIYFIKRPKNDGVRKRAIFTVLLYLLLYSLLRFSLEFIRIDYAPVFFGLRWPQITSLLLILASIIGLFFLLNKSHLKN